MARTVEKILKDDESKAPLGIDEEDMAALVDGDEKEIVVDDDKGPTPEETVIALSKRLEEANARADREASAREEAEKRANTASATAGNAVQSQIVTHEAAITSKINAAKTNLDSVKQQLKQAKAAGDSDAEVELQDAMATARYDLNTAEWEKNNFERWKEEQKKVKPAPADANRDPYTAKEHAWISAHPEFNSNERFARLAKSAAGEARGEGIAQDSNEYFQYIEDALRLKGLIKDDSDEPLSGAGKNTNASVAAAPNRSGSGSAPVVNKNSKYPHIPNGFRIPSDWVQAATDQGFDDPREYANDRLKIEAEEKANRS